MLKHFLIFAKSSYYAPIDRPMFIFLINVLLSSCFKDPEISHMILTRQGKSIMSHQ